MHSALGAPPKLCIRQRLATSALALWLPLAGCGLMNEPVVHPPPAAPAAPTEGSGGAGGDVGPGAGAGGAPRGTSIGDLGNLDAGAPADDAARPTNERA